MTKRQLKTELKLQKKANETLLKELEESKELENRYLKCLAEKNHTIKMRDEEIYNLRLILEEYKSLVKEV